MKKTYSIYEAKAQFSELVRMVREHGVSVTISYHGKPVAELRPTELPGADEDPMEKRIRDLIESGEVIPAEGPLRIRPVATIPGALQQFLEDRNRF